MIEQETPNLPFAPVTRDEAFFPDAQRVECVNFLLHLAPYSEGLLHISGDLGSGKSTVLQQFLSKAADNWRVCSLEAGQLENLSAFLREIQQAYGFSLHGANDDAAKITAIFDYLGALQKKGIRPLLIIDDAHMLVEEVSAFLDALMEVVATDKSRLGVILLADERLNEKAWFSAIKRFGTHGFALMPLSLEDTARYIQHHLAFGGYAGEVIPQSQIKKIYKLTHGNLGQTNQLALAFLRPDQIAHAASFEGHLNMETETAAKKPIKFSLKAEKETTTTKKPIKFSRILFGILTVALVLALFFEDEINAYLAPSKQVVQQQKVHKIVVNPKDADLTAPPKVSLPQVAEEVASNEAAKEPMKPEEKAQPAAMAPVTAMPAPVEPAKTEQAAPAMTKQQEPAKPVEQVATTMPVAPQATMEKKESAPVVKTEPKSQEVVEPKPAPMAKAPTEQPKKPTAAPAASSSGIKSESWVLEQNPQHFILQIMSFTQESGVGKTLAKISDKSKFAFYKSKKDGQVWYRLAYGPYPDRKSANEAIATLPGELGKVSPWVRQVGDVQKEIAAQ